jgi:hypothetical protein
VSTTFEQTDLTAILEPIPDSAGDYCMRCERELPCVCGHLPYVTLFIRDENLDAYIWCCNVCGLDLRNGPCELHTPTDVPGLERVECTASPRHEPTWTVANDGRYENCCPWCLLDDEHARHPVPEPHERHGRWRSWRATRRVVRLLEVARVTTGHTFVSGGGCPGCVHRMGWRWTR